MNTSRSFSALMLRAAGTNAVRLSGLIVLAAILMAGCTLPSLKGLGSPAPTQEETTSALPESTQVQTPAKTDETDIPETDSPTLAAGSAKVSELSPADLASPDGASLSGLIVFTSLASDPFASLDLGAVNLDRPERHLWGISPDGQRAGRLSPEGQGTALFLPENGSGPVKIIANGLAAQSTLFELVPLPEECAPEGGRECSEFNFGPEGRTLAYYTGAEGCGRGLSLVDLVLNQTINTWASVQWYEFFQNGSLILSLNDCSDSPSTIYLYIPNKDTQAGLGQEGKIIWNPSRQAALIQVSSQTAFLSGLWGFNLDTSRVFLWIEKEPVIDDTPVWLEDGQHFLYQHRPIQYFSNSDTAVLEGPRQIILMDAWSRDQRLLAFDAHYNYHLCSTSGAPCELRYGDWLKVRRTPFKPTRIPMDEPDLPEALCALYGQECQEPAEEMALNWKTGEILPWDEAGVTEPAPAPAFPLPDLSSPPVYSDPGGAFALYTGPGGRTLWYVPGSGEPVLWVTEGENFVYLP